jgi:hypothetical protein
MEDPVLGGIYDRLKENDSEPSANKFVTIFLRWTSGRGKSSFFMI